MKTRRAFGKLTKPEELNVNYDDDNAQFEANLVLPVKLARSIPSAVTQAAVASPELAEASSGPTAASPPEVPEGVETSESDTREPPSNSKSNPGLLKKFEKELAVARERKVCWVRSLSCVYECFLVLCSVGEKRNKQRKRLLLCVLV